MYSWHQKRLRWTMRLPFLGWWVHGKQKEGGGLSKGTESVSGEKEVVQSRKKKECTICWCKRLSKKTEEAAGNGLCPGAYACMSNPDNHKRQRGSVNWNHLTGRGGPSKPSHRVGKRFARQAGPKEGSIYPILYDTAMGCQVFLCLALCLLVGGES